MRIFRTTTKQLVHTYLAAIATIHFPLSAISQEMDIPRSEQLRWHYRLLFVNATSVDSNNLLVQWQTEHKQALKERKLLILIHRENGLWQTATESSTKVFANQAIAESICHDCLVLVGLDGGIKTRKNLTADSLDSLFDLIDAMPMRRAELRQKTYSLHN